MVCIDVFESNVQSQTIRTLMSLTVIIFGDIFYLWITGNLKRFKDNKLAYLNVWLTISIVLGVSVLRNDKGEYVYEHARRDHVYYGILIALLVYVPLNSWLSSTKYFTALESLYQTGYGIFLTALAALITFMVAESSEFVQP